MQEASPLANIPALLPGENPVSTLSKNFPSSLWTSITYTCSYKHLGIIYVYKWNHAILYIQHLAFGPLVICPFLLVHIVPLHSMVQKYHGLK